MRFEFSTCHDVTDDLVSEALAPAADLLIPPPRVRILALLQRMYQVAEPGRGAPRILLVLARVAPCSWLEGELVVRMRPDGEGTRIELLVDDGASMERLCPAAVVRAPMQEFSRALALKPERVKPLVVEVSTGALLLLRASVPPEISRAKRSYEIAHQHILQPDRQARPPAHEPPPPVQWSRPVEAPPPPKRKSTPPPKKASTPPPKKASTPPPKKASTPPPRKGSAPRKGSIPPPKKAAEVSPESKGAPPNAEAITVRRPAPAEATTRMPANQAAELVARIRLRKQNVPVGAVIEETLARSDEAPTPAPGVEAPAGSKDDDVDGGWG